MYEEAFKSIDNSLRGDSGCSTELDYIEQTSWVLFLKYLDDYERGEAAGAEINGKQYNYLIQEDFRWASWASPKKDDGTLDRNAILNGDDLREFVNEQLFPHLASFRQTASSSNTIEYKIGEIFSEVRNKLQSGYVLRDVIDKVDGLSFSRNADKHELSNLYEDKIQNMGNAGRNGGEYYTPRPLIKAIVKAVNPRIGETVYDGAAGSAGFLCEAYAHMRSSKLSPDEFQQLQSGTFFGKEKKSLAYVIGTMNMILHGIEAPNIVHTNTLAENILDIQQKDQFSVILANPPFGSKEPSVQQNFPIKTSESAYMFLQHFIKMLKHGGRGGVVIKSTFLNNLDKQSIAVRKQLLTECNLQAILDLPKGVFSGAGIKTVVLFFEKGKPTEKIWYYQLALERNLGKTSPLNDADLSEFVDQYSNSELGENSWVVDAGDINQETWDLSVHNPNSPEEADSRTPKEIVANLEQLGLQAREALQNLNRVLKPALLASSLPQGVVRLDEVATVTSGNPAPKQKELFDGGSHIFIRTSDVGKIKVGRIDSSRDLLNDKGIEKLRKHPKGTILFPKSGASTLLNHRVIMASDGYVSSHLATIKGIEGKVIDEYLFIVLQTVDAADFVPDISYPSLSLQVIKSIPVPIPSLEEQMGFVDNLNAMFSEADKAIAATTAQVNCFRALKPVLLATMLKGK